MRAVPTTVDVKGIRAVVGVCGRWLRCVKTHAVSSRLGWRPSKDVAPYWAKLTPASYKRTNLGLPLSVKGGGAWAMRIGICTRDNGAWSLGGNAKQTPLCTVALPAREKLNSSPDFVQLRASAIQHQNMREPREPHSYRDSQHSQRDPPAGERQGDETFSRTMDLADDYLASGGCYCANAMRQCHCVRTAKVR